MTASGDEQVDPAGSGTSNVVASGQGNQVLSNVSAGRDVVLGDKVEGDQVAGDKFTGDKVAGNKFVIEQLVLQSSAGATVWSWPRPWDFGGYLQEKRKGFTGRQWLFDQVSAWHHDPNAPQALLIEADFGVGKSAFMAELCATGTTQRQLPVVAHHFCDHYTAATLEAGTFLRSLAAQLALALPAYKAAVESDSAAREWLDKAEGDPASAFSQAIASKLAAIEAPSCHQLLLVDGLDETLGGAGDLVAWDCLICFGLRPAELQGLQLEQENGTIVAKVTRAKKSSKGSSGIRKVPAVPPAGWPRDCHGLLQRWAEHGLPPHILAARSPGQILSRQLQRLRMPEDLSSYGLRHAFALRLGLDLELHVREAAELMGHSPAVHLSTYGRRLDGPGLLAKVARLTAGRAG